MGRQVVVENRLGANGAIGPPLLVRLAPDDFARGYGQVVIVINLNLLHNRPSFG